MILDQNSLDRAPTAFAKLEDNSLGYTIIQLQMTLASGKGSCID